MLLAHRRLPATVLQTAMTKAIEVGVTDPQVLLIDARRDAGRHTTGLPCLGIDPRPGKAVPSGLRVFAHLP